LAERVFIDTTVLLYADDLDAGDKRGKAQGILRQVYIEGNGAVSTQVLEEFFVASSRKLGVPPKTCKADAALAEFR